jgi:hypothetical protein
VVNLPHYFKMRKKQRKVVIFCRKKNSREPNNNKKRLNRGMEQLIENKTTTRECSAIAQRNSPGGAGIFITAGERSVACGYEDSTLRVPRF